MMTFPFFIKGFFYCFRRVSFVHYRIAYTGKNSQFYHRVWEFSHFKKTGTQEKIIIVL
ncbi:hypothetical protein LPE509_02492 [Legionella pneumophila subsp. pneumophila LPE509]|nr:hypothetical protein LPE509_02492 [Legionella pneumophila subsp. pneumophila LPE509]